MALQTEFSRDILVRHGILTLNRNGGGFDASYRIVIPFNELYREWEKMRQHGQSSQRKVEELEIQATSRVAELGECGTKQEEQMQIDSAVEPSPEPNIRSPTDGESSGVSEAGLDETVVESGPTITGTATEEEPHVCEVCGRPFRRKKDLRRHVLTHSTERPFECPICYVGFKSREYLQRHRRRIHDNECISPESISVCTDSMSLSPKKETENSGTSSVISKEKPISVFRLDNFKPRQSDLPLKKRFKPSVLDQPDSEPAPVSNTNPSPVIVDVEKEESTLSSTQQRQASPDRGSLPPSPIQQNPGRAKLVGGPFQCETCRSLVPRSSVMVVYLPKPVEKPRIVCKKCFSKKTGLLCID